MSYKNQVSKQNLRKTNKKSDKLEQGQRQKQRIPGKERNKMNWS